VAQNYETGLEQSIIYMLHESHYRGDFDNIRYALCATKICHSKIATRLKKKA